MLLPASACITRIGCMNTDFKVGDLLQFKPASEVFEPLPATVSLVLVTKILPTSTRFFYGRLCNSEEEHLWSYDQFLLRSRAGE
jgi:hypothetical protein